ncbi:O-antigen ligase family protein [Demequina lignilytica]|uniref:O-antigen ligase-related domain-containing protein n=1 Tax=Demequina lignilytica TaxID=3051663 RepID=A0AB35MK27_9MICO|nr:O-antigen ligase family protein [Demequina sp. SYSU T0a273]MDN4484184.1 hypothetical protein [Demequina sp. SYSU T0a273]
MAIAFALATLSYTASTLSLGGIPVVLVLILLVGVAQAKWIVAALRDSAALRVLLVAWMIWSAITVLRLVLHDWSHYGTLALRDSVITFSFGALFVGAGAARRHEDESIHGVLRAGGWVLIAYGGLFLVGDLLPPAVLGFASFQNIGPTGVALVALGLWGTGKRMRISAVTIGIATMLVGQGRMSFLVLAALIAVYLIVPPHRERGSAPAVGASSLGRVATVVGVVLLSASALTLLAGLPGLSGRIGAISSDTVVALVTSVFDDSSELAGTRQDRERWWAHIGELMAADPDSYLVGLGLGPDLIDGFRSSDGVLVRKPHNDYLEAFARTGALGGLALVALVGTGVVATWRALSRDPAWSVAFGWAIGAATAAFAQPYFSYPHGSALFALVGGAAMASNAKWSRREHHGERTYLSRRRRTKTTSERRRGDSTRFGSAHRVRRT